jgi:hypothetical protein
MTSGSVLLLLKTLEEVHHFDRELSKLFKLCTHGKKKGSLGYLVNGPQHSKHAHAAQNTYVLCRRLPLVSVCHTQASPLV